MITAIAAIIQPTGVDSKATPKLQTAFVNAPTALTIPKIEVNSLLAKIALTTIATVLRPPRALKIELHCLIKAIIDEINSLKSICLRVSANSRQ